MNLARALRLPEASTANHQWTIAFVGSGGKSTALFQLAHQLPPPVIVSATTHLHIDQIRLADSHWIAEKPADLAGLEEHLHGVTLVTGPRLGDRTKGLDEASLSRLRASCKSHNTPLLLEADGSRQLPLKAPAEHEPAIPPFVDAVVVVAGLSGLGKPLTEEYVHRPEIFAHLSGLRPGETIPPEALVRVLSHPAGGLKNIPPQARRLLLINQCDTPELQSQARGMVESLLPAFHAVIIASLGLPVAIHAVVEPVAGIILAAGGSSRFGQPKPLLDFHGKLFVRAVAESALAAGLSPVVVVTGAKADSVGSAVSDLPLVVSHNPAWQDGQSTSIQVGLRALPSGTGAAIFLLADQPQVPTTVLRALCAAHARTMAPIVAPLVQGQRANPVLFDRLTFPALRSLHGDIGGRAVFSKFPVMYMPWHDEQLLSDVDTSEDYRKLVDGG
jgi:molybdenum cofactor cytidylyltransferase